MDIYSVYFALLSLAIKIFTKYCLESKGMKWYLPAWLAFMLRRDGWMVKCTLQMIIITVLVSLFSCLELVDNGSSPQEQSLEVKLKNAYIYKSIILSFFVLTGIKCKTPILMAPWLNFTLKNLVTLEVASLGKYYLETPDRNVLSFSIFIAMAATIFIMQIHWWILICNYYSFLWNETFDRLAMTKKGVVQSKEPTLKELELVRN